MDPNAEDGPPKADVDSIEAEVKIETQNTPTGPPGPGEARSPLLLPGSSAIFRDAFGSPRPPPPPPRPPVQQEPTGKGERTSVPAFAPPEPIQNPDELKQAQEAEFERRIRGEYQAAQQRLSSVVHDNMDRPLRLTSIRLSPSPPTTRTAFLNSLLSPFLGSTHLPSWLNPAPSPPETLHEVLLSTRSLMAHLDKFGIFDVENSAVRLENRRGGDPDEVELVLGLRERGRLFLKAGTEVGGGEGGGNVTGRIRNALGGGETLEGQASIGTKTKSAYSLSLTSPIFASPLLSFGLSGFSFDRDNTAFASHREQAQGGRAKLTAIAPWGTHDLTYEYIMRDINNLTPSASVSIRELAQPSTKSSLAHTWTSDTRDDPWLGSSGRLLKLTHEYAGLPGSSASSHFFKSVTQSQLSRHLYPGSNISYSISSITSFLFPMQPRDTPTALPDRLYLGGPNSVRGWKVGGMGLHDAQDSLGGEMSWGMGLSVFAPIWGKAHWPLRSHGFLNVGKVTGYDRDGSFADNVAKMYRNPNVSVGLGLLYRLDPIRIEVNFSMPLIGRKGERTARGFGVGVGLEFL